MAKGKKAAGKAGKTKKQPAKSGAHHGSQGDPPVDEQLPGAAAAAGSADAGAVQQAVVGLSNLGNTCFFNSSVQMLLACAPLQQMLQQREHDITRGPLGFALQQVTLHAAGELLACSAWHTHCCRALLHPTGLPGWHRASALGFTVACKPHPRRTRPAAPSQPTDQLLSCACLDVHRAQQHKQERKQQQQHVQPAVAAVSSVLPRACFQGQAAARCT